MWGGRPSEIGDIPAASNVTSLPSHLVLFDALSGKSTAPTHFGDGCEGFDQRMKGYKSYNYLAAPLVVSLKLPSVNRQDSQIRGNLSLSQDGFHTPPLVPAPVHTRCNTSVHPRCTRQHPEFLQHGKKQRNMFQQARHGLLEQGLGH